MKYPVLVLFTLCLSSQLFADTCWSLYEAESKAIQDKDGYTKNVGGQIIIANGGLSYHPGIKVQAKIDNWARDLLYAIKWGPMLFVPSHEEDPQEKWLQDLQYAIKKDCPLKDDAKFETIRAMMTELMNDGSFCPNNKILEPGFFSRSKEFKRIFKAAVKDNKFPQFCMSQFIQDDSSRDIKETAEPGRSPTRKIRSRDE